MATIKRLLLAGMSLVSTTGCLDRGEQISAEQALPYFHAHRESYEQIVILVERCRPQRSGPNSGYNRVWADHTSPEGLHCARGGQQIEPIVEALRRAEADSVSYSTDDNPSPLSPDSALRLVSIGVYSAGLAVSGTTIDFVYSVQPLAEIPEDEVNTASGSKRKAVTGPPYHWYWEQTWS